MGSRLSYICHSLCCERIYRMICQRLNSGGYDTFTGTRGLCATSRYAFVTEFTVEDLLNGKEYKAHFVTIYFGRFPYASRGGRYIDF